MTRKELDKYFSRDIYDGVRNYANRIMDAYPEITDAQTVLFAAGKMEECADDGAYISVEDALRLTKEHAPIPTAKDFMEILQSGGIETQSDLISLIEKAEENTPKAPENIHHTTAEKAATMTRLGHELANGNKDIVLMGIPADLSWSFAQLKLAFFADELSADEQAIIQELRSLADETEFYVDYGIGYAVFRINIG